MAVPIDGTPEAIALWKRIESFSVDVGDEKLTFVKRLARENGWSEAFAKRVFEEYKRFLFLACASGHKVTPSDEVDQAWHLHLVYTESYWEHLCHKVLERPLHHGPTKGGHAENAKFEDWYARTLASYRRLFGDEPPKDIWPSAAVRFGDAGRFKRIDTGRHVLVPRAAIFAMVLLVGGGLVVTASLAQASAPANAATGTSQGGTLGTGVGWMIAVVGVVAVLGLIRVILRGQGDHALGVHHKKSGSGASGCGAATAMWAGTAASGCGTRHDSSDAPGGGSSDGGSSSGCGSSGCGGGGCGS